MKDKYQSLSINHWIFIIACCLVGVLATIKTVKAEDVVIRTVDTSAFPLVKLTVSTQCEDILSILEGDTETQYKKGEYDKDIKSRQPSQTIFLIDIYHGDESQLINIRDSLFLTDTEHSEDRFLGQIAQLQSENNLPSNDEFAVFAASDNGTESQQLQTWTTIPQDAISSIINYSAASASYTALTKMIDSALDKFKVGKEYGDRKRSLIVYTNGIDKIEPVALDRLIEKAHNKGINIYMVLYNGGITDSTVLIKLALTTEGGYYELDLTPKLEALWAKLFPFEKQCELTYRMKQLSSQQITINASPNRPTEILSVPASIFFTDTDLLKPFVAITSAVHEITGTAAISLSGEIPYPPTVTPAAIVTSTTALTTTAATSATEPQNVTSTSTISETFVPVLITWSHDAKRETPNEKIAVNSITVTLSANRPISPSDSNQSYPNLMITRSIVITDAKATSQTVQMPVSGLPYGNYQIYAMVTNEFGVSSFGVSSSADGDTIIVKAPYHVPTPMPTPLSPDLDSTVQSKGFWRLVGEYPNSSRTIYQWLTSLFAIACLVGFVVWWIVRGWQRVHPKKLLIASTDPVTSPHALLYRESLQLDADQVIGVPSAVKGIAIGATDHAQMAAIPQDFAAIKLESTDARGSAYVLHEKNGEFWLKSNTIEGDSSNAGQPRIITPGEEIKLSKLIYRLFPLRKFL